MELTDVFVWTQGGGGSIMNIDEYTFSMESRLGHSYMMMFLLKYVGKKTT